MQYAKDRMISVRISKDTHKRLQEYKERTGVSIIFMMNEAVSEYLDKKELKKDG